MGGDRVKLTKCDTREWDEKCHYTSGTLFVWPMVNLQLYYHIILYWEKVNPCEKFSHSLSLEVQIVWKISAFQCYWWKYRNVEKQLNSQTFQLKWWILKHFTRSKHRVNLRKSFTLPSDKSWTKIFIRWHTGIYRYLLSKCFENAVLGRLEMVNCKWFFSDTNQKHVCWKICKMSKVFGCVAGVYFLNCWMTWGL